MKSGIYKILCVATAKFYIGSTIDFKKRFREHKHYLNNNIHHSPYLQNSWIKYKIENFEFQIMEIIETPTKELLLEREQFYIDTLNPVFNVSRIAGSPLGFKHSDKFKEKARARQLGRVHTKEHNQKIAASLKDKPKTKLHGLHISLGKKGKKDSSKKNYTNSISHRDFNKWPCSDGIKCKCKDCKEKKNKYMINWRRAKALALKNLERL